MRNRVRIALAVLLVMLAGIIAWLVLRASRERRLVYEGKPYSVWLASYHEDMEHPSRLEDPEEQVKWDRHVDSDKQAIQHIGTNALPSLIGRLTAQDTKLKKSVMSWANKHKRFPFHLKSAELRRREAIFGYMALGPLASNQVPRLIEILENNHVPDVRQAAAQALGFVGPEARLAAPALFRATKDKDHGVRICAFVALGSIRPDPPVTIPVLVAGLDDPHPLVGANAAAALGKYGREARAAVPALLRVLAANNAVGGARRPLHAGASALKNHAAASALKRIDPEAAAKAGVKQPMGLRNGSPQSAPVPP
jgi:HEAT repeat protein